MLIEIILFCVTVALTFILYKLSRDDRSYFEKRNIKSKSTSDGWKDFIGIFTKRYNTKEFGHRQYNLFPEEP